MTKYKIQIVEGCLAFDTKVNGESFIDIPEQKQHEIVDHLLKEMKQSYLRGEINFESLVQNFQYDDYEHDPEVCGSCGDTVSTTTWNI